MNDLKDLFELALTDGGAPAGDGPADPAADLARGKKLLARRRRRRVFGAAAVTAAVAAGVVAAGVVATVPGGPGGPGAPAGIRLVAYSGAQPPGYTVTVIPAGWVIQGSNPFALVIAPANAPNSDPDVFVGKLIVTQEAFDQAGSSAQGWSAVHVAGHVVYYAAQIGAGSQTAGLVIEEAPGRWLLVQAPTSLGWTRQQMVRFGLGVTVLPTAQEGKG